MSSLKTNALLNIFNTVTGIIFPIVTFPSAARVLLPEGIGVVNFLQSILSYVVMLTSLGIPMYAVREVARHRDDVALRNRTTVEILVLSAALCLLGYAAVWALGAFVPQINADLGLFYVLSLTILFTSLGANWFYQAVEDFKFITIRSLVIRLLSAAGLFLFVKSADDLLIYGFVIVGGTVGNNVVNFVHLRRFIPFGSVRWSELQVARHLRPAMRIFVLNFVTSIYLELNVVMLGFMKGDAAVGLFAAGNRLTQIVLTVVASLCVVVMPRCSNLFETGRMEEFAAVCRKSLHFVVAMSLPCTLGLIILSQAVVLIFCGGEFGEASRVLCWTAPVILFIGLSNVFGLQVLYPQGRETLVIWSTVGGAVFNLLLNLLLIPRLAQEGAAISTFAAELTVLVIQVIWGRRYFPFRVFERSYLRYVLAALLMAAVVWPLSRSIDNIWGSMAASVIVGATLYGATLWVLKDPLLREILQYAGNIIHRKH